MLIVKKYGGSSVSSPEKILSIAKKLKVLKDHGNKLIVIVSAMGNSTDDLVELSRQITHTPIQREFDMLLSAGERISMALMSMALNSIGCEAISFTGSQSGVFTDGSHNNARVIDIKAFRVEEELRRGKIVIIAGFQGVDPVTKEITTLGRGGSDTTAVALAGKFKAQRCDILTDVRGLYSVDPRVAGVHPKPISNLNYDIAMEMAYWGARVLHYRSVELASRLNVEMLVHLHSEEGEGTTINSKKKDLKMEATHITAVNYNSEIAVLRFPPEYTLAAALESVSAGLGSNHQASPKIVYERTTSQGRELFLTAAPELFEGIHKSVSTWCEKHQKSTPTMSSEFATVSVTGWGLINSQLTFDASRVLTENEILPEALITTPLTISFIVPQNKVQLAAQKLHQRFIETVYEA
jgi:aspartate kinase